MLNTIYLSYRQYGKIQFEIFLLNDLMNNNPDEETINICNQKLNDIIEFFAGF